MGRVRAQRATEFYLARGIQLAMMRRLVRRRFED
jgi:hypothetical protein